MANSSGNLGLTRWFLWLCFLTATVGGVCSLAVAEPNALPRSPAIPPASCPSTFVVTAANSSAGQVAVWRRGSDDTGSARLLPAGPFTLAAYPDEQDESPEWTWPEPHQQRAWRYLVVHHSAAPSGSVETIDAEHRERTDRDGRPWLGIGYHFVIGNGRGMPDGAVEPTFRWREQLHGAHAGQAKYNEQGIGICLIGDFEKQVPTARQEQSARQLISALRERYAISRSHVLRHMDLKQTACPGKLLPLSVVLGDEPERTNVGRRPARRRGL